MMQMHARLIWMEEQEAMHADDSAFVLSLFRHLHGPKFDCAGMMAAAVETCVSSLCYHSNPG